MPGSRPVAPEGLHLHGGSGGPVLHARPDPLVWVAVPGGGPDEPGVWAKRTAARFAHQGLARGFDEGVVQEDLVAGWRARSQTGVVATFVAYLEECLTTVDVALLPAAPDGPAGDLRLGLCAEFPAGSVLVDRAHHERLGPAQRALRVGFTDEPDEAIVSIRCLWRLDELTDLLVTVVASDAEALLKVLPAIDALLDTLAVCTAPATPPGNERAPLRLLQDVISSPANQDPDHAHIGTPASP